MRFQRGIALMSCCALALGIAACGSDDENGDGGGDTAQELSGSISIDGSSTVAPLSQAAAEGFQEEQPNVRVSVGTSGTGGGFEKFCRGETDISDASRAIEEDEIEACKENGIDYVELQVANDGLAIPINNENDWATCITADQLNEIWKKGSKVKRWSDVDPQWPDETMALFGPGTDSGTFDYFTEAINGEEGDSRTDYNNIGEDDNAVIRGVEGDKNATGYVGLSYIQQNEGKLKAAEVDGGDGCVAPSSQTVQDGSYKPLSRPLFIYLNDKGAGRPEVQAFVKYYLDNAGPIAEQALFVPMTDEQVRESEQEVEQITSGSGGGNGTTTGG